MAAAHACVSHLGRAAAAREQRAVGLPEAVVACRAALEAAVAVPLPRRWPVEPAVEPAIQRLQSACPRLDSPSCSRRRRRRARRRVDLAAAVSRLAEIVPRLTEIVAPLEPLLARGHLARSALPAVCARVCAARQHEARVCLTLPRRRPAGAALVLVGAAARNVDTAVAAAKQRLPPRRRRQARPRRRPCCEGARKRCGDSAAVPAVSAVHAVHVAAAAAKTADTAAAAAV
mmetsp:Transcript_42292/g.137282  ORF Transcript_42292/g.137282 Transcript_42292/m.137282 type:complete len:231 (+) Transcript_42292:842-1534(+)